MEFFRTNFPKGTIPIKMHMVEDHAVQWARSTHVGFGLLGERVLNLYMLSLTI